MSHTHATVFAGGHPPRGDVADLLPDDTVVLAADSGWHHAVVAGLVPSVLVGDLDSIGDEGLAAARAAGCEVVDHPVDKDATDVELALLLARDRGATRIDVVSGGGDRPDHVLALLHVLAADDFADTEIGAWLGRSRLVVCRAGRAVSLPAGPGDTVSLVPIGGDATVSASGLQWALDNAVLRAHSSRGVSNVALSDPCVTVHSGRLLAFVDGAAS